MEALTRTESQGDFTGVFHEKRGLRETISRFIRKILPQQEAKRGYNHASLQNRLYTLRHKLYNLTTPPRDVTLGGYVSPSRGNPSRANSPGPEPGQPSWRRPHPDLKMCHRCGFNVFTTVESFHEPVLPQGLDIEGYVLEGEYGGRGPLEKDAVWIVIPGFEGYVRGEAVEVVERWAEGFYRGRGGSGGWGV